MNKKQSCVICSARPVSKDVLRHLPEDPFVIAADAGWKQARELGLVPDVALGDFDSSEPPQNAKELIRLPTEKDDPDTFYAIRQALDRGFRHIILLGSLGGRLDHSLANIGSLLFITQNGATGTLLDKDVEVHCMGPGTLVLPAKTQEGCKVYVSIFPAGGVTKGVTLRGLKYPLTDHTLIPGQPLAVSNEFMEDEARISCTEGFLYVMIVFEDAR